jgi:SprT protein
MNVQALKKAALDKVEEAYVRAEAHYGRKFTRVPVEFSTKQKVTAGTAHYRRSHTGHTPIKIKLSLPLLMLNGETFIEDTPGHEAAHLIAVEMYGSRGEGHGAAWMSVMRVIDQEAKRTHNMKTARVTVNAYCLCTTHEVSKGIAQKILAGRRFTCKKCKTPVKLDSRSTVNEAPRMVANAPAVMPRAVVAKATPATGVSKASVVRAMLVAVKFNYTTVEQVLADRALVERIAAASGLNAAACKSSIKYNWSKV